MPLERLRLNASLSFPTSSACSFFRTAGVIRPPATSASSSRVRSFRLSRNSSRSTSLGFGGPVVAFLAFSRSALRVLTWPISDATLSVTPEKDAMIAFSALASVRGSSIPRAFCSLSSLRGIAGSL